MGLIARYREQSAATAPAATAPPVPPDYATGVVHHDAVAPDGTVTHHHQRFSAGRLEEWELDDRPGPWALVRQGDVLEPCPSDVASPERIGNTGLRIGAEIHPLPMLDELEDPGFSGVEQVPDADLRLRFELIGSPTGVQRAEFMYRNCLRTGHLVEDWDTPEPGSPASDAPELAVSMTFRNYLRMRTGEISALEAIADGGSIDGRWTLMLLLHGLVQDPVYVATYRASTVLPAELGWWGEVAPWIGTDGPLSPSG